MDKKYLGSDFDDFLQEEGILEEVEVAALNELIVGAIADIMKDSCISLEELAERLNMSLSKVRHIFDSKDYPIDLLMLYRLAKALDKDLETRFS